MEALKAFWRWLTVSRHEVFLEQENERLWHLIEELQAQRDAVPTRPAERSEVPVPMHRQYRTWSAARKELEAPRETQQTRSERQRSFRVARRMEDYKHGL